MNLHRTILMFLLTILSIHHAMSATVSNGNSLVTTEPGNGLILSGGNTNLAEKNTRITLNNAYNIFVDGDLFIDYSVFSQNQDLFINADVSISGGAVTIFSFSQDAVMPNLSTVSIFKNLTASMSEVGDILIFSDYPILSGVFEASRNVYIGNYTAIRPVPLPASLLLFVSGIIMLARKKHR